MNVSSHVNVNYIVQRKRIILSCCSSLYVSKRRNRKLTEKKKLTIFAVSGLTQN
jgi:hypothetical protein